MEWRKTDELRFVQEDIRGYDASDVFYMWRGDGDFEHGYQSVYGSYARCAMNDEIKGGRGDRVFTFQGRFFRLHENIIKTPSGFIEVEMEIYERVG